VVSTEHPHQQLYNELLSLFARHDPIGLVKIGAPNDEYSPEVERILPRLGEAHSVEDLERIVHEVFVSMFDERLAKSPEHYRDIALEAWEIATRLSSG
jgi:hypothetical protein